jgi:arginine metabolism regulation protein II
LFTWDFDPSQQTSFHYSDPIASATGPDVPSRTEWRVNDADASLQEINHDQGLPFELDSLAWPKLDMDVDAPLLLKHFNDKVIDQMGSLPVNEKSPWRILNYPSAIMTFTQLAVLKIDRHTIKHACLSNFYALIAVSAFHLSLNPIHSPKTDGTDHHWASVSMATYEAAKYHLSVSLLTESKPPNKGKYKVQLMAIASILTTSVSFFVALLRNFSKLPF